jgi:hypothetical protein
MASVSQQVLAAIGSLDASFIGSVTSDVSATTYNFGDFSAPTAGLMVVVFTARGGNSHTVSSISIGGTNGGLVQEATAAGRKVAIGYREVPAGNNNVTVTLSGSNGANPHAVASVWFLSGYVSATPHDSDAPAQVTATSQVVTLDLPVGGFAAFGIARENSDTITWSSATELNEWAINLNSSAHASISPTVSTVNHAETITLGTSRALKSIGASWR